LFFEVYGHAICNYSPIKMLPQRREDPKSHRTTKERFLAWAT